MAATKINKPAQFYYNYFQVEMDHPVLSTVKPELYSMDGIDMSATVLIPRDSVSPEWHQRLSDEASTGIPSTDGLQECVMFGPNFGSGNEIVPLSEFPDKSIMVGRITNSCIIHPEHLTPQLAERLRLTGTRLHRCARIGWFPVPKAVAAVVETKQEEKEEPKEVECPVMQAYIHGDKWCVDAINDDGKTERIEIGFVRDESVVPDFSPVPVAAKPVEPPVTVPVPVRVDIDVDAGQPSAMVMEAYSSANFVPMPAGVSDRDRLRILEAAKAKMEKIIEKQVATKDLLVSTSSGGKGKTDSPFMANFSQAMAKFIEKDETRDEVPPLVDPNEANDNLAPLDDDKDDDGSMLPDDALKLRNDVTLGHLYLDDMGWWCVNVRTAPCGVKHSPQFPAEVITLRIAHQDDGPLGYGRQRNTKMHIYGGPADDEREIARKKLEQAVVDKLDAANSGQVSYKQSLNKWAFVVNPPSPPAPAAAVAEKPLPTEENPGARMKRELKDMKPTMFRCVSVDDQGYCPDVSVGLVLFATGNGMPECVDIVRLNMSLCQAIPATPLSRLDEVTFVSLLDEVNFILKPTWEKVMSPFFRQFAFAPKERPMEAMRRNNVSLQTFCKALRNLWYMSKGSDGCIIRVLELINTVIYCDLKPAIYRE